MGDSWVNKNPLTNIISFSKVADKYRVTYDSNVADEFNIHKPTEIMKFRRNNKGLYLSLIHI